MRGDLLNIAQQYLQNGFSFFPVRADGSKAPDSNCLPSVEDPKTGKASPSWKPFQKRLPFDDELVAWYSPDSRLRGFAVVHGSISGNSEVLDFDKIGAYEEFAQVCDENGFKDLLDRCVRVKTPSGGDHVWYRCEVPVQGNQKLAWYVEPAAPDNPTARQYGDLFGLKTAKIETRGEGGYTLVPGSPKACHPDCKLYSLAHGRIDQIPVITNEERNALLSMARACTEIVEVENDSEIHGSCLSGGSTSPRPRGPSDPLRPGDDYNQRGDVLPILQKNGWTIVGDYGGVVRLRRPGKTNGVSATYGIGDTRLFYIFTSSAAPFQSLRAYQGFSVYGLLECGGDFEEAARRLSAEGFGEQIPINRKPRPKKLEGDNPVADNSGGADADSPSLQVGCAKPSGTGQDDPSDPPDPADPDEAAARRAREKHRRARREKSEKARNSDGLPCIETNDTHLRDMTMKILEAIHLANDPPSVFVRSGDLVRINTKDPREPTIEMFTEHSLRGRAARVANFVSTSDKRGTVPVIPPIAIIQDLMKLTDYGNLPRLESIVRSPVVAPDGTLLTTPGYLPAASAFYFDPDGIELPDTSPTDMNVDAAKDLLLGTLLFDFPFADNAARSHALAMLLLPFIRPFINGSTPLHVIDAPAQGTGKSLLAEVISAVFLGSKPSLSSCPDRRDDEEWRKKIMSVLLQGPSHVIFDNIKARLESGSFAGILTARKWTDRVLGGSQLATVAVNCVWALTGNNIQLDGDFPRRSVWIRLNAQEERPEDRDANRFKIRDIDSFVIAERPRLVAACLTLIRAWLENGRPEWKGQPIGSFVSWSRTMGGIMETIGVPGFMQNRAELYERADSEREQWVNFVQLWFDRYAEKAVAVADLIGLAQESGIVGEITQSAKTGFGKQIVARVDSMLGGYFLLKDRISHKTQQYRLSKAKPRALFSDDDSDTQKGDVGGYGGCVQPDVREYQVSSESRSTDTPCVGGGNIPYVPQHPPFTESLAVPPPHKEAADFDLVDPFAPEDYENSE